MRLSMLLAVCSVAVLATIVALAQPQRGMRRGMRMYDPATEVTVKGTIEDVQQMAQGRRMMGTHVTLKTDAGILDVHLGPSSFLAKKDFTFAKGDQIEVTGSKGKYNGVDAVIAREVKKGDKTLTLRDKNGVPEWAGPKRPTS